LVFSNQVFKEGPNFTLVTRYPVPSSQLPGLNHALAPVMGGTHIFYNKIEGKHSPKRKIFPFIDYQEDYKNSFTKQKKKKEEEEERKNET